MIWVRLAQMLPTSLIRADLKDSHQKLLRKNIGFMIMRRMERIQLILLNIFRKLRMLTQVQVPWERMTMEMQVTAPFSLKTRTHWARVPSQGHHSWETLPTPINQLSVHLPSWLTIKEFTARSWTMTSLLSPQVSTRATKRAGIHTPPPPMSRSLQLPASMTYLTQLLPMARKVPPEEQRTTRSQKMATNKRRFKSR